MIRTELQTQCDGAMERWLSESKSAETVAAELGINSQTLKAWKRPTLRTAPGQRNDNRVKLCVIHLLGGENIRVF
jgi:hypothetical protein